MKPETVDAIHDATLKARELVTTEISEQLEGIYGLLPSGQFKPVAEYPTLGSIPEAAETRRRLETHLADEQQAGLTAQQAREKLVKEAAFTWLNRLVAFKMMETRRLLRQTVTRGQDSNGFKMWLTEQATKGTTATTRRVTCRRTVWVKAHDSARIAGFSWPNVPAGAGNPRAVRSRQSGQPALSTSAGASRIDRLAQRDQLQEAWQPGSEETIGWVYQAFNAEELEQAFREVRLSKKKFEASDIPSVTQLFTPRWIVRFLVENTLGRLWMNMHPDSHLGAKLEYLVPEDGRRPIPLKSVREITLLDPACGTMHFGLVAFDLFVEMYREEMANAGKPGWPEEPPLDEEEQIPAAIVAHNLHGIDIDLRAVQLSALTLYLKAKTLNPKATLKDSRLACADIHMLDGDRLQQFLAQAGLHERPIYGRFWRPCRIV